MKKLGQRMALLAGILLSVVLAGGAQNPGDNGLAGNWEGSVLDPRRPYFVTAEFAQDKGTGAWTGKMSVIGNVDAPLQNLTVNGSKVSFAVQLRQGSPLLEGEIRGKEFTGKAQLRGAPVDFRLTRLPALAAPKDRVEGWHQDLDVALRFTKYDRTFTAAAREEYRKRIEGLKARVAALNDSQIFVEIAKAVALGNNGHTQVAIGRSTVSRPFFQMQLAWFKDGLYVVRAGPAYASAVGCRVTAVEGRPTAAVKRTIGQLYAGNAEWVTFRSALSFVRPEVLHGFGITKELEKATYSLDCAGTARELPVATGTGGPPMANPSEFVSVFKPEERPRYLRHRDKNYWYEYLPVEQVIYFQFNSSLNGGDETIPQFGDRLVKELEEKTVKALVVDMRFNGGGNLDIGESTIEKLRTHPKLQGKNKLFVITGNATFSAAIFHASQLRGNPDAVFVGEPVGDRLEFWAEGDGHILPNSRLVLRSSNGYHSYSPKDPPEFKPYFRDLSVTSLGPDLPVSPTFKEYAAGRDVALEAILARVK